MSVEFEKIVLEKFDNLNSKINELSGEIHEVKEKVDNNTKLISSLSQKVNNNTELVSSFSQKVNNNTELVSSLSQKVNNNTELVSSLSQKVDNNSNLINTISSKLHTVEEKIDQQGLNFAKFENEFTIKIQALFDSFVANTENHLSYEKSIAALHAKTFHHDTRISVLEDYVKDTKLLANN